MTDTQIRSFLAVARHLNFSSAAKELCISQATISMHVSALEKNLGYRLLQRDRHNVSLTPQGEMLRPVFEQAIKMLDDAIDQAGKMKAIKKELKIGQVVGLRLGNRLTEAIHKMQKEEPEIRIEILGMTNMEILAALDGKDVDVAILPGRMAEDQDRYAGITLLESQVSVVCSGEENPNRVITPEKLSGETFVVISPEVDPYDMKYLEQLGKRFGFTPKRVREVLTEEDKLMYVRLNRGVCIADHTSRVYGNSSYLFHDVENEFTKYQAVRLRENYDPMVASLMNRIGTAVLQPER